MVIQGDWEEVLPCKPVIMPLLLEREDGQSEATVEGFDEEAGVEELTVAWSEGVCLARKGTDYASSALYSVQVVEELSTFGAQPLLRTLAEANQLLFQADSGLSRAQVCCIESFLAE